jgi:hypothetical protein
MVNASSKSDGEFCGLYSRAASEWSRQIVNVFVQVVTNNPLRYLW